MPPETFNRYCFRPSAIKESHSETSGGVTLKINLIRYPSGVIAVVFELFTVIVLQGNWRALVKWVSVSVEIMIFSLNKYS